MLGEHEATSSRQLARTRRAIRADVERRAQDERRTGRRRDRAVFRVGRRGRGHAGSRPSARRRRRRGAGAQEIRRRIVLADGEAGGRPSRTRCISRPVAPADAQGAAGIRRDRRVPGRRDAGRLDRRRPVGRGARSGAAARGGLRPLPGPRRRARARRLGAAADRARAARGAPLARVARAADGRGGRRHDLDRRARPTRGRDAGADGPGPGRPGPAVGVRAAASPRPRKTAPRRFRRLRRKSARGRIASRAQRSRPRRRPRARQRRTPRSTRRRRASLRATSPARSSPSARPKPGCRRWRRPERPRPPPARRRQ